MSPRVRLVVAALLGGAMVAGGIALERRVGPRALPRPAAGPLMSGAWYCPHSGGEGWRAWLALANPGETAVQVRLAPSTGQPATETLEPSTLRYVEVAAPLPGSATAVESFGAPIGAGMVAAAPEGGVAAEPCAREGRIRWDIPEVSTLRGEEARLVVHNPFAAGAVIDVSLVMGQRLLRPGRLQGLVLEAGRSKAFVLNNFALGAGALGVTVDVPLGRAVAAAVTVSNGGVRADLGVPGPAPRWLLPGLGSEGALVVRAPAGREAPIHAELNGPEGSTRVIDLEAVPAGGVESFAIGEGNGGVVAAVDGLRAMVAGRRMAPSAPPPAETGGGGGKDRGGGGGSKGGGKGGGSGGGSKGGGSGGGSKGGGKDEREEAAETAATDLASTHGAVRGASLWLAPPAVGPEGGASTLLVQNPAPEPVDVRIRFLGVQGPAGEEQVVTILPAATSQVPLPPGGPFAAVVDAGDRRVVVAQAATAPEAFAVSLGTPLT